MTPAPPVHEPFSRAKLVKKSLKLVLIIASCTLATSLGIMVLVMVLYIPPYAMTPTNYRRQLDQIAPGMSRAQVEEFLEGYTSIQNRDRGTYYLMEPEMNRVSLYPKIKFVIIVRYDEHDDVVEAEWADL